MRIGIDFDNTIANYDGVFHAAALERGLISAGLATGKNAVRDHLNGSGRKDEFTILQGYVYGSRMDLASVYEGLADFVRETRAAGHTLFVISHKTRHPMLGPQFDMHAAARRFLVDNGLVGATRISDKNIFFELTKEEKIARAALLDVDVFIDDLPEILHMPGLPAKAQKILFSPSGEARSDPDFDVLTSWADIAKRLLDRH